MRITGITPCTLLDFPDTPSCILFFAGCNFRCGYCHNPEMVLPEMLSKTTEIPWQTVLTFLERRKGLLEGVVLCGGEPTIVPELEEICIAIKNMGFKIKLDTNGSRPAVLQTLLEKGLIDYLALDFKCPSPQLESLCKGGMYGNAIEQTLAFLLQSGIPYEVRTTVIQEIHSPSTLRDMAQTLSHVPLWYLQSFRPAITLDEHYQNFHAYPSHEMEQLREMLTTCTSTHIVCR